MLYELSINLSSLNDVLGFPLFYGVTYNCSKIARQSF
jgi:hypothetical protein